MRNLGAFRRFLILLAFVVLPLTTYLTVSHVSQCEAQTCQCGGGTCIQADQMVGDFVVNAWQRTGPAIAEATNLLIVTFAPLTQNIGQTVQAIAQWGALKLSVWFNTFWDYNLHPAMMHMTGELSTASIEQNFSIASFADAVNINRKRWAIDEAEVENHRSLRPSSNVCTTASLMGGITRADRMSDAFNGSASASRLWRSSNNVDTTAEGGFSMDLKDRWSRYVKRYCKKDYNNGTSGCADDGSFPDQDVDVVGMIFKRDTIPIDPDSDPDEDTINNLHRMLDNVAEPFVKDPVSAGQGAEHYALFNSQTYKARRQVVYDGLDYIVSRRIPAGLPQDFVDRIKEIRGLTGEDGALASNNPSRYEVLRALMTQRFRSGKYALSQIDEPENNQREQVVEQALQLIQMSDQLDLMDHYQLLLAAQVSEEVKAAMGDMGVGSMGVPLGK